MEEEGVKPDKCVYIDLRVSPEKCIWRRRVFNPLRCYMEEKSSYSLVKKDIAYLRPEGLSRGYEGKV